MNTTLSAPRRHDHPPQSTALTRRVGPLDRLALRVGLALIVWGRRPARGRVTREQLILLHVQDRAREQRDRANERGARLSIPPR